MALNPRIVDWQGKRVWLLGASSGIGAALARALAQRGAHLVLSGRHAASLQALSHTAHAAATLVLPCDATDPAAVAATAEAIAAQWGGLDMAIYLAGDYQPLRAETFTPAAVRQLCEVNYLGAVNFAHAALPLLPTDNRGGLVLVASVAGYRGLPKALGYGPAKAALIHLAEVLYLDLHARGTGVWLVNPGFVATRLTAQNDFRMPALISPDVAVTALLNGLAGGGFEIHFPKRFTCWMRLLRLLPYAVYLRLLCRIR